MPLAANTLKIAYDLRLMHEAALPLSGPYQAERRRAVACRLRKKMGPPPPTSGKTWATWIRS